MINILILAICFLIGFWYGFEVVKLWKETEEGNGPEDTRENKDE